ncbi:MAG TPA: M20/M25/M40 family metallo-hydrolase [Bacillota bacterium]
MREPPLPWTSGSTEALAGTLAAWIREDSLCDTEGEARFGRRLAALVQSLPYFRRHPERVVVLPAQGAWQPPVVAAWVRGEGAGPQRGTRPVVVLTGHYDTVGVDDLLAHGVDPFDPPALAEHLARRAPDEAVRCHAASGAYLFGRGGLDMKAGLVAGLAALEALAGQAGDLPGDVLWIATPDEKNLSRGAVAAREWLHAWLEERGAACAGLINTDYVPGPGSIPAYFGAIGKLLPSVLVTGLTAHVGDPLAGLDPITLAAEIVRAVSLDPELREHAAMPPPVPLRLRDLKEAYSVQTAPAAAGYFNLYFERRSVAEVMGRLVDAGRAAVRRVAERYAAFGRPFPEVPVLRLSDLAAPLGAVGGGPKVRPGEHGSSQDPVSQGTGADPREVPQEDPRERAREDPRERARERVMAALESAGGPRPSVVWHIGPGCWAPVPDPDRLDGGRLRRAVFAAAAAVGAPLRDAGPYPFISDMSVFAGSLDVDDLRFIRAQYAGEAGGLDTLPPAGSPALPCVNLGPCGEGPHSPFERVHIGYSLGTLPRLLAEVARRLLAG